VEQLAVLQHGEKGMDLAELPLLVFLLGKEVKILQLERKLILQQT